MLAGRRQSMGGQARIESYTGSPQSACLGEGQEKFHPASPKVGMQEKVTFRMASAQTAPTEGMPYV